MNRFTLSLKITYLVTGICGLFCIASLWLYFSSSKEVWSSASLYRVEFVSGFLAAEAATVLQSEGEIDEFLNQVQKNQSTTIESAKLAFFDRNLTYLSGLNVLSDSDRIGVRYEHHSIQNMRDFIRSSGPLLDSKGELIGYYRFEFFNNEFQTNLKGSFSNLVKTTFLSFLFLIIISFLVARNGIARPYEELQEELIHRLEKVAQLSSKIASEQGKISNSLESRTKQLNLLENALDAFILSVNSSQNSTQTIFQDQNSQTEFSNSVQTELSTIHDQCKKFQNTLEKFEENIQKLEEFGQKNDILTLNTFLEVTRASEDAQGFSVLAAEIRKLNQLSAELLAKFPREISEALEDLQASSEALRRTRELFGNHKVKTEQYQKNLEKLQQQSTRIDREVNSMSKEFGKLSLDIHELHKNLTQLGEEITGLWQQTEFVYDLAYDLDSSKNRKENS